MSGLQVIERRVMQVFADKLQLEIPSPDEELLDSGVVDSLGLVELLAHLEEVFGIQVSVDDLEIDNFRTVGRIAQFVAMRQGAGVRVS